MKVQNLCYKYSNAEKETLQNVSFELSKDKLNVLIGLNGAGKTTLFDCMTETLPIKKGALKLPSITEILYLTQNIFYSSELTGKDMALFLGSLGKLKNFRSKDKYLKSLNTLREKDLFNHLWDMRLGKMSVGERKWLFVMLLACIKRKLYIFDEPTSGVDPSSRRNIMKKLDELVNEGSTCLISTHQLHDLSHINSNVIFLHSGEVLYQGDYHEWLNNFKTEDPDQAFVEMVEAYDKKQAEGVI